MSLGAILLAGGRGSRVAGAVKPLFEVGGQTLLGAAVTAVTDAGADAVVVAGPDLVPGLDVTWVREDPPFGGPAAGTVAALGAIGDPDWIFLLACDLPAVGAAVSTLAAAIPLLPSDADGVCLGDGSSRPQWLIGLYRTSALRQAASALPSRGDGASMRDLLADLAITVLAADDARTSDIDTWEDLAQARRMHEEQR
ncbi:molybdenum cofactor guanylyltransferase [Planococcus sp. APC 4015]|nr:molybdenum cofactor guanylyltransferase [Planococcus sp. APC 4015]